MQFPEKPTVHVHDPNSPFLVDSALAPAWREPRDDKEWAQKASFRTCYYCGSIHPGDLLEGLRNGALLKGSDWKYGWPHKFYVEGMPNLRAGELVPPYQKPEYDFITNKTAAPTVHAKWYNDHLLDRGFDDEARDTLIRAIHVHSGILFKIEDGKIKYAAPSPGYQR